MQDQQDNLDDLAEQARVKLWDAAEYEAGRAARLDGLARSEGETVCWRMGWQDADISLLQAVYSEYDTEQSFTGNAPPWSLYALGRIARANGLPFGIDSPEVWKYGWIQMDIDLAVSDPRNGRELVLFRGSV